MIGWLRRDRADPWGDPKIEVSGRTLPITIRRHKRAQRLTMRLAPDGSELRITLPSWGRSLDAIAFAQSRTQWIETQLERVPARVTVDNGAEIAFRGAPLVIAWQADAPRSPKFGAAVLKIGGPPERIEPRVQRWLEQQALGLMADDLAFYCERATRPVPQLRLSRARRRWGSCSSERTSGRKSEACIRINWRLVMAPDDVRRSVVAHEVAHLSHFDHSPAFHAHLSNLFESDLGAADRWLKTDGRSLYASFA